MPPEEEVIVEETNEEDEGSNARLLVFWSLYVRVSKTFDEIIMYMIDPMKN